MVHGMVHGVVHGMVHGMVHGAPIFAGSAWKILAGAVYFALLALGGLADARTRRVPNRLVAILALAGLAFSALAAPVPRGLWIGAAGMLVGLAIWLPSWLLHLLGAGDV